MAVQPPLVLCRDLLREKTLEIKRYWGGFGAHMSGIPKSFSVEKNEQKRKEPLTPPPPPARLHTRHHNTRCLLAATAK
jgi:hypothetical protein